MKKLIFKKKFGRVGKYFAYQPIEQVYHHCGEQYSVKKYISQWGLMLLITVGTAFLYQLNMMMGFVVVAAGLLCVPRFVRAMAVNTYHQKRFFDIDMYLHQMVYSFQRQPKISLALEDTAKVVQGDLQRYIRKAQEELEYNDTEYVYERALHMIEQEYQSSRITTLHKFLISVEKNGGKYQRALQVLLMDFDHWGKRVRKHQKEIGRIKTTLAVGIVLSFLLAGASVMIAQILKGVSEIHIDITQEWGYQAGSAVFLILNLLFFVYTQCHFTADWEKAERSEKQIIKDYQLAFHTSANQVRKHSLPLYVLIGLAGAGLVWYQQYIWFGVLAVFLAYMIYLPQDNIARAKARIREDVFIGFSNWLRDVALRLQEEPMLSAIENTYEQCPVVMQESLQQFIFELEESPGAVEPYYHFMGQFGILDITTTVHTLYSMTEMTADRIDETIHSLIERNYELMNRYEEHKNQDQISAMKFAEYIPTFFVSFKIAIDMMLVVTNYL